MCGTRIQLRVLNNRCQTEERKEAFAFLLLWTLFFPSSHFFSCHDSVNRSLSFSHACCILMRDQFLPGICKAGEGPAPFPAGSAPPVPTFIFVLLTFHPGQAEEMQQPGLMTQRSPQKFDLLFPDLCWGKAAAEYSQR